MDYNVFGSIETSMVSLWVDVMQFLPELVLAVLILVVGWIIGGMLSHVVEKVAKTFRLDEALDKAGVDELSRKAGYSFRPSHFLGTLVKWFVIVAFAVAAFDILRLNAVTDFMREVVLGYLPNVFAAVLILFASILVANVASKALAAALRTGGSANPEFFEKIAYYLVASFGTLAALNQLQIADELVQTLFMGIVFAVSLALGLAFGLGGKETASKYLHEWTKK